jgi:hypothetical protein
VQIRQISKVVDARQILSLDLLIVTDAMQEAWDGRQTMEWDFKRLAGGGDEG